jgi:hypothetical protein
MELRIEVRKVMLALYLTIGALLVLHVTENYLRLVRGHRQLLGLVGSFDMNWENNIPTFFSVSLLLACAALLFAVAAIPEHAARNRKYWRWLSLVFLLLALDEMASLHELWTDWIHWIVPMGGPFYFAWVIPAGLGVVVVGLLYLRFVLRLPVRTRWLTIASGALYVGGAMGMEMVGGSYLWANDEDSNFTYALIVAAEETIEMCGSSLYVYTLLDYLRSSLPAARFGIRVA